MERSDSSPSTTSHPDPTPALPPSCGTTPADDPGRIVAELPEDVRDERRRRRLSVCATDDDRPTQPDELGEEVGARPARNSSRVRRRDHDLEPGRRPRVAGDVHVDAFERVEEDRLPEVPARDLRPPRPREVRVRRESGATDADEVELAALERKPSRAHPRSRASRTSSSAISSAARGRASCLIATLMRLQPGGIGEQLVDERRHALELALVHDERAPSPREVPGVERLMVARRVRVRDENRGSPRRRELPHRPAGARDREIRRRQRLAERIGRLEQHVVAACDARAQRRIVALSRHVQHRRAALAERIDRERIQRLRARETAEDGKDRTVCRQPEPRPRLRPLPTQVGSRDRTTGHAVLAAVTPGDGVREEDAPRERRRQAVGEPEVCVRLGERRRDPAGPCRQHHRPRDVAATAEDDVRPPMRQDSTAGEWRTSRLRQRSQEIEAELAREPRDRERVELEARVRNQLRLDAIGRPGEGHAHAALAQSFRDCECRPHVAGCPSGRDHAPKPRRRFH